MEGCLPIFPSDNLTSEPFQCEADETRASEYPHIAGSARDPGGRRRGALP